MCIRDRRGSESDGEKITPTAEAFAAKYRDNPRAIAKYLNDALSTGDPVLITKAIGDMVRAQGVTSFSQKAGVRRETGGPIHDPKSVAWACHYHHDGVRGHSPKQ